MSVHKSKIKVFTDGASKRNPGAGGWGVVIIYAEDEIVELGGKKEDVGNNHMELMAVVKALDYLSSVSGELCFYTDSAYVVNGVTSWLKGWLKNNWVTSTGAPVRNLELWKKMHHLLSARSKKVSWFHVPGHSGIVGNERADRIASCFAENKPIKLFSGEFKNYPEKIDMSQIQIKLQQGVISKSKKSSTKPYSYVSLLAGKLKTHKTWKECEKRVKGASGAKFKKAISEAHEKEIIDFWLQSM